MTKRCVQDVFCSRLCCFVDWGKPWNVAQNTECAIVGPHPINRTFDRYSYRKLWISPKRIVCSRGVASRRRLSIMTRMLEPCWTWTWGAACFNSVVKSSDTRVLYVIYPNSRLCRMPGGAVGTWSLTSLLENSEPPFGVYNIVTPSFRASWPAFRRLAINSAALTWESIQKAIKLRHITIWRILFWAHCMRRQFKQHSAQS